MSDSHTPGPAPDLRLDCQTCLAVNTTACNDCIVSHLLANDDGPIDLVTTPVAVHVAADGERAGPEPDPVPGAVQLLARAGLLDDEPVWVDRQVFDQPALAVVR